MIIIAVLVCLLYNVQVTGVDSSSKTLSFSDGTTLNYDKLLLATGAK